jgi:hypothetical protein
LEEKLPETENKKKDKTTLRIRRTLSYEFNIKEKDKKHDMEEKKFFKFHCSEFC